MQVHQCFSKQHAGIRIVRKLPPDYTHGVRISFIECRSRMPVAVVSLADRIDIGLLDCARVGTMRARLLYGIPCPPFCCLIHRLVDVETRRKCHTPIGHRRRGIKTRGFFEGHDCLFMVEGIHEPQTLIKVSLSLMGVRRDGMMEGAEIVKERHPRDMAFSCRTQIDRQ